MRPQAIVGRDASGAPLFCEGASGWAHVEAHRLLDAGQPDEGHRVLGAWLASHEGDGSDWIHLQWHMAVFEIATGLWSSAFRRFARHILPSVSTGDAHTDAPSLLWRLSLATPAGAEIPWEPVRDAAVTLTARAPQVSRLGGSRAQNELFEQISQEARWRAEGTSVFTTQRAA